MKNTGIFLIGLSAALAACSSEQSDHDASMHSPEAGAMAEGEHQMGPLSEKAVKDKKEAAELLLKRFGAASCAKADLLGSTRRTSPDEGDSITRAYQVSGACAQDTIAAVKSLGFTEGETGLFAGTSADGAAEEIRIVVLDDGSEATVEWESGQK